MRAWCGVLIAAGLLGAPPRAGAQLAINAQDAPTTSEDPAFNQWLAEHIAELDSPDVLKRENATEQLGEDPRVRLGVLERWTVAGAKGQVRISPEQQRRLQTLALKRFAAEPRGAMGVQFSRDDYSESGVEVGSLVNGFDAKRVLLPGDVITTLSGVAIGGVADARAVIVSHDPGDEVVARINRRGERMDVRMKLGSYQNLGQASPIEDVIVEAWRIRVERLAGAGNGTGDAVRVPTSAARWGELMTMSIDTGRAGSVQTLNGRMLVIDEPTQNRAEVSLVGAGSDRSGVREWMAPFSLQAAQGNPAAERLMGEISRAEANIRRNKTALQQKNVREADKRRLEMMIQQDQRMIELLKIQIRQMKAMPQIKP